MTDRKPKTRHLQQDSIWDEILGQPEVVARLQAAVEGEEVSHAFLFWGPEGVGKKKAARVFAAALNCAERKSPGICLSCKKTFQGNHPDVYEIEPEGDFLTIEQIRAVQHAAHLKPSEGKAKVFIVDEADRMTAPAANAFLKTLEEPPAACFFVLISSQQLDDMLPTVVSRCQLIHFNSISRSKMKELLVQERGLDEETADVIARASGGAWEYALVLAESEEERKKRSLILSLLAQISQNDVYELLEQAAQIVSAIQEPLAELKDNQEEELEELVKLAVSGTHATHLKKTYSQRYKREASRKEHAEMERVFDLFSSWYSDLLRLKQGIGEENLVNIDHVEKLRARAAVLEERELLQALEVIRHSGEMARRNVNSLLALETMLLRLADVEG